MPPKASAGAGGRSYASFLMAEDGKASGLPQVRKRTSEKHALLIRRLDETLLSRCAPARNVLQPGHAQRP